MAASTYVYNVYFNVTFFKQKLKMIKWPVSLRYEPVCQHRPPAQAVSSGSCINHACIHDLQWIFSSGVVHNYIMHVNLAYMPAGNDLKPVTYTLSQLLLLIFVVYSKCPYGTFLFFCVKLSKIFYMVRSLPQGRSYFHCLWGQLSTTCSNVTEVAQWATHSCSRPQPATDNGVRDGRFN